MGKPLYSSEKYFEADFPRTLFPLETTRVLVRHFSDRLKEHIYTNVLEKDDESVEFPPQQRCYAAKHDLFLRRTVKLDPVAEYFLYDIVYRNRKRFRKDHRENRKSFGYRFDLGKPESAAYAYGEFKRAVWGSEVRYRHWVATDVATYFNAIYHHDLVDHVRDIGWEDQDVDSLGRFLRFINAGRSVDCLPQGIHPAKALGADFLRFVDDSHLLKSDLILRFQDDIHIFDNDEGRVAGDLLTLQALLGEKSLSLNDAKTSFGPEGRTDIEDEVEGIRYQLLERRRQLVSGRYDGDQDSEEGDSEQDESETDGTEPLDEHEVHYLLGLLTSSDVEESDAELVLVLLRDHADEVLPHMLELLRRFPGLSKNVYTYVRFAHYLEDLEELVLSFLLDSPRASEFQIFWLTKMAQDFLGDSEHLGDILIAAYEHLKATLLTQAKVLEHPDPRFGLNELREEQLRSGRSDWLAWAAAAGTRGMKPASRNHRLTYFANGSPMNKFIAGCIKDLPAEN